MARSKKTAELGRKVRQRFLSFSAKRIMLDFKVLDTLLQAFNSIRQIGKADGLVIEDMGPRSKPLLPSLLHSTNNTKG